jgi:hypothetical protein
VSSSNRTISWKPPSHGGDGRVVDMIQVWTGLATKFWTLPGPGVSLKSCGVVWCETRHRQSCGVEKRTDGPFFLIYYRQTICRGHTVSFGNEVAGREDQNERRGGGYQNGKKIRWSLLEQMQHEQENCSTLFFILGFRKGSLKLFFKWLLEAGMRPVQNALMNF